MSNNIQRTEKSTNSGILTSAGTALEVNTARCSFVIQNLGQNELFVKEGSGASTTDFNHVLAAGSGDDDGTGGKYESPAGQVYTGIITVAGTSPRFIATERTIKDNSN